jgi:hypothetical protein
MSKAGATAGYGLQFQSSPAGRIQFACVDGSANSAVAIVAVDHWLSGAGGYHDVFGIVDRSANILSCVTELGASSDVAIGFVGSPSNTAVFSIGAQPGSNAVGSEIAFAAVATGDITNLRTNAAAAIQNIRRFSGRS